MAMITLTSSSNTNISQTLSFENGNNLRDASFSSYLNGSKETFVLKLAESSQNPNSSIPSPQEHHYIGRKKVADGEIDVFGAEKYFNETLLNEKNPRSINKGAMRIKHERDEPVVDVVGPASSKTQPGTPSVHSESSWNSQNALLHSNPRNQQPSTAKKTTPGWSFLASLGCNCVCSDKNSVNIDEHNGEKSPSRSVKSGEAHGKAITKQKPPCKSGELIRMNNSQPEVENGLNLEDRFSFPVLGNTKDHHVAEFKKVEDHTGRNSLDVFGSPVLERGKKSLSLERRLTMVTWDALTPRVEDLEISHNSNRIYNDSESDASSDLFEIESFSTNTNSFLARQASDGMSNCVTPTTCYAPSEASIEWSVATASAVDYSINSDSEDLRTSSSVTIPNRKVVNVKNSAGNEVQKRRPGILVSCKSHKSVRVAGEAYRISEKAHKFDPSTPLSRFQAESKVTGPGSRHGQHGFNAPSISGGASRFLYIQQ
ncbi:unnamed protein product [Ilex paraguariensis]|uniref:Phytochrome kinase substrate 1 n=1 Tax=Ilex paraguariensis TaxID=185542 RepID=A0ABC8QUF4_9AQUA